MNKKENLWKVGDRLEAKDYLNCWYKARIIEHDASKNLVLVHFEGWNQRYDEWLHMKSGKLRAVKSTEGVLQPGQYVLVGWLDGENYPARIRSVNRKQSKYDLIFYTSFRKAIDFANVSAITIDEYNEIVTELKRQDEKGVIDMESEESASMRECGYCGEGVSELSECLICHRSCCSSCYKCQQQPDEDDINDSEEDNSHDKVDVHDSNLKNVSQNNNDIATDDKKSVSTSLHTSNLQPNKLPHPSISSQPNVISSLSQPNTSIPSHTTLPAFFTCIVCFLCQDGLEARLMDARATELTIRLERLLGVCSSGGIFKSGDVSGDCESIKNESAFCDKNKNGNLLSEDANDVLYDDVLMADDCDDDDDGVMIEKIQRKVEEMERCVAMKL